MSSETAFLEDYVLGIGDTLEMSCDLEDASEPVAWFKDGVGLAPGNRTRLGQRMLRIINVSYEDSGVYSCRLARSNALLSNYTIRVTGEGEARRRRRPAMKCRTPGLDLKLDGVAVQICTGVLYHPRKIKCFVACTLK